MPLPCVVLLATAPLLMTTRALSRAWDMIAVCTQKSHRAKHLAFGPSGFWKPFTFSCYDKNDNYRLGAPGWSGGFLQIDALLFPRQRSWATQNCRTSEKTLRLTGNRSCVLLSMKILVLNSLNVSLEWGFWPVPSLSSPSNVKSIQKLKSHSNVIMSI